MYDLQVKHINVEPIILRLSKMLSQGEVAVLRASKIEARVDEMIRAMVVEMWTEMDRTIAEVVTLEVKVPSTWWQHFKEKYFPLWLAKWYPVVYTYRSESVQRYNLCPHNETGPRKGPNKHIAFLAGGPNALLSPPQPQPLQPTGWGTRYSVDGLAGEDYRPDSPLHYRPR